jgi:hypothetical protein
MATGREDIVKRERLIEELRLLVGTVSGDASLW